MCPYPRPVEAKPLQSPTKARNTKKLILPLSGCAILLGMFERQRILQHDAWCWIFFWPLVVLGLLSEDHFYAIFFPPRGASLSAALKASTVLSPVAGPWSAVHPAPLLGDASAIAPVGVAPLWAHEYVAMASTLRKPSCCDAPDGLCHFWDLPRRLGIALAAHGLRPALTSHPGQSHFA